MAFHVLFRAVDLVIRYMGPPEGIGRQAWHARLGRTCRAGNAFYPEGEISFEVGLIFDRQDLLEQGQRRGAARRDDDARAARMMFGAEDSKE